MCVTPDEAVVVNVPTEKFDYEHPDEQRLDPHGDDIPYDWQRKDR